MKKGSHELLKSAITIICSAVCAFAAGFGIIKQTVYSRSEGIGLEKRVDTVEQHYREDVKAVNERLDDILKALKE